MLFISDLQFFKIKSTETIISRVPIEYLRHVTSIKDAHGRNKSNCIAALPIRKKISLHLRDEILFFFFFPPFLGFFFCLFSLSLSLFHISKRSAHRVPFFPFHTQIQSLSLTHTRAYTHPCTHSCTVRTEQPLIHVVHTKYRLPKSSFNFTRARARARVYVVYTRVRLVLGIVTRPISALKIFIIFLPSFQFLFSFPFFFFLLRRNKFVTR